MNLTFTYAFLEFGDFFICEGIGLGNDGNEVYFRVQSAHELDVELLKADME